MKTVNVVAAVIMRDDCVLATQRGYGEFEGGWEFPGGKVEVGESPEEAIVREIAEELAARISIERYLCTVEYDYPTFHLSMRSYLCRFLGDRFELLEHHAARWLNLECLDEVEWLPADIEVVEALKNLPLGN